MSEREIAVEEIEGGKFVPLLDRQGCSGWHEMKYGNEGFFSTKDKAYLVGLEWKYLDQEGFYDFALKMLQVDKMHIEEQKSIKVTVNEDMLYYYPFVDGENQNYRADTKDVAMLLGLQVKYQGLNSQFAKFALRMLGIESGWAE